jgi:conjugative relaxase-like TrwC/TraI family protein
MAVSLPLRCVRLAGLVVTGSRSGRRVVRVFVPRKFQATAVARIGRDLWGYLRGGREQADYYLGTDGTPSAADAELHGQLWARLGVHGLDRVAFERLAAGLHPVTGTRLVKTSHVTRLDPASGATVAGGGFHVPGIDCNLSPPKSVSALLPFLPAEQRAALQEAHLAAVRVTVAEIEQRVALCRPTVDGQQVHTPGELGFAVFTHHTSRPSREVAAEPGRPPDPNLHSHAFLFNLAYCQGRYLAVDSRPLYAFATTAQAIYACELAAQLQRLGHQLCWRQTRAGWTWELAGVDQRVVELFSSRHRQIEQQAADFQTRRDRPPTLRERGQLAASDRAPKTDACRAPHWPAYRTVLARHDLSTPCVHRHRAGSAALAEREAAVRARLLGPEGLTRQDATFDEAHLAKATFQAAAGLLDASEARGFLTQFLTSPDLVPVATPEGPRLTTAVLLAQERRIVQVASAKARTRVWAPRPELLAQMIELAMPGGVALSAEQQAALWHLARPVGWASLEGHAGTGKTTLLRTLVAAYRGNGQPVVVVATAAETARRIARELGLERGWTVEAFTRAVEHGQLCPQADWVVLVEEAAMMDTPRMATLLEAAGPASIRTLGDPEQAQAVGAGGWHRLVDPVIGGHAELTTVVRQRHQADREVCRAIRDGHAPQALADLAARGRLHLSPDRSCAVKELVHAWDGHRRARGLADVAIVTDTDNVTVDTLNALCQARRLAAGELTGAGVTVADLVTGRGERLYVGDRVRFVRPFIAGDLLRCYVANGTGGQVTWGDPQRGEVTVACDDGRAVTVAAGALGEAQPLRLGYAGHALKLQGGQAEVVLVLPGGWQSSRQSAYSMATRCVEELYVYLDTQTQQTGAYRDTDPIRALGQRWSRDAAKRAATTHLDRAAQLGHQPNRDEPLGRSRVDDDPVVAPPEPHEPAPLALELARERDLEGGLGIDVFDPD